MRKRTRAEQVAENRKALLQAAAEVIGEYGYAEASITRITERAGLGQGTFYRHFESRQELFDILLPAKGIEVLDYLQEKVRGAKSLIEMEQRGFIAFFEYANENPWFFRLLHEAQVSAPAAYEAHINNIMVRFRRALRRSWEKGELAAYDESELDTLAYLLISARDYVYSQYVARSGGPITEVLPKVAETYRKFLLYGLGNPLQERGAPEPSRASVAPSAD
ncbi:TetR/AcrR family transcriptional regulator [Rhodoligotrophos defluvii]|uniref:TetR/AcrR family transcriptional regulator n=1 Tax=Rhodoligotrophos defluvii TaxID=2561934 RepID=UPI00148526AC|nr:TetR/AcrR family transcriptional regulator [Rhodoligotrophos defluvii]